MLERYFVNQPSTLQVLNKYHGIKVLFQLDEPDTGWGTLYFTEGDIISMRANKLGLSKGWPVTSKQKTQT